VKAGYKKDKIWILTTFLYPVSTVLDYRVICLFYDVVYSALRANAVLRDKMQHVRENVYRGLKMRIYAFFCNKWKPSLYIYIETPPLSLSLSLHLSISISLFFAFN
jgi:hypothetical protein